MNILNILHPYIRLNRQTGEISLCFTKNLNKHNLAVRLSNLLDIEYTSGAYISNKLISENHTLSVPAFQDFVLETETSFLVWCLSQENKVELSVDENGNFIILNTSLKN